MTLRVVFQRAARAEFDAAALAARRCSIPKTCTTARWWMENSRSVRRFACAPSSAQNLTGPRSAAPSCELEIRGATAAFASSGTGRGAEAMAGIGPLAVIRSYQEIATPMTGFKVQPTASGRGWCASSRYSSPAATSRSAFNPPRPTSSRPSASACTCITTLWIASGALSTFVCRPVPAAERVASLGISTAC